MKKAFLIFVAIIFGGIYVYSQTTVNRDSQWDFFANVIPKQKSITISGSSPSNSMGGELTNGNLNWRITIDDKYNVSFSGDISANSCRHSDNKSWNPTDNNAIIIDRNSHAVAWTRKGRNGVTVTYRGTGSLVWDNDKMKIMLTVNASGQCSGIFGYDLYEGRGNSNRRNTNSGSDDIYSSGNSTFALTFDLQADYNTSNSSGQIRLLLSQSTLTLNMYGDFYTDLFGQNISFNYPCRNSSIVGGNTWYTATAVQKSQSELNAASSDQFGNWNWNADRTRLFLKSQNSDNKFVILNNNGTLTWCMEMLKGTKGSSESTTDTGDKIINLAIAFDGAPVQNFSFVENNEGISDQNFVQFDYAVYNRFLETLDKNSNEILNQFKDKKILMLSYTLNGVQKTDMFMLGGLETILEHM